MRNFQESCSFYCKDNILESTFREQIFGKPESKSKVQAQSLFFKGVSNKSNINKKYYHSWMGGLNLVYILYLNRNEWNKVVNKLYDDSVKLKRTEMDPLRLGLVFSLGVSE